MTNSTLCQPGQCVDESEHNNQITCRPCNKLIVYIRTNAPFKTKKTKFEFNANDCSVDLKEYQDALLSSYLNKYDLHEFNLSSLNKLESQAGQPKHMVKLLEINSGVLPANYSIKSLKLPVTAGTCIIKAHPSVYLYLSLFAALCAIFMVCSLLLYNYAKTRTVFGKLTLTLFRKIVSTLCDPFDGFSVGRVNRRKVVFYVPAKDKIHYERLEDLAKSYKKALKVT